MNTPRRMMHPRTSIIVISATGIIMLPVVVFAAVPNNRPAVGKPTNTVERSAEPVTGISDNILRLAQQNAERLAQMILDRFDNFESRIQSSTQFSDATKAAIQKNIDDDRAFVREKLVAVQSAKTPQELRAIIREVLDYMRNRKSEAQQYRAAAQKQFAASLDTMEKKNDDMVKKIEGVIIKLNAKGFDTTTVTVALEDYKDAIFALRALDITTNPGDISTALGNVRVAFRELVSLLQSVIATVPAPR